MLSSFDFSDTPSGAPDPILETASEGDRVLIDSGPSEAGWHRLEKWLRCRRLWAYEHLLELRLGRRDALNRGTLIHVGLAHHYARWAVRRQGWLDHDGVRVRDPDVFYSPMVAMALCVEREEDEEDRQTKRKLLGACQAIVRSYVDHYRIRDTFKVIGVEQELRATVGPKGHLFTARADLVYRDDAGGIHIMDHKTAARPGDKRTVKRYALSGQVHGLINLGRSRWGRSFRGLYLNIVGWNASGPPVKFLRAIPDPAPNMTDRMVQLITDVEEEIAAWTSSGRDPYLYLGATSEYVCMGPYGPCEGWSLCALGRSR